MSPATRVDTALRRGLDQLRDALHDDPGGGTTPADETAWFRLVDEVAVDQGHESLLEEVGSGFAKAFVTPYLHAADLAGIVREVGGLLSIHHRGRIALEAVADDEAIVLLTTLSSEGDLSLPTPFERSVLTQAVRARFPGARVESQGCDEGIGCERLRIRIR